MLVGADRSAGAAIACPVNREIICPVRAAYARQYETPQELAVRPDIAAKLHAEDDSKKLASLLLRHTAQVAEEGCRGLVGTSATQCDFIANSGQDFRTNQKSSDRAIRWIKKLFGNTRFPDSGDEAEVQAKTDVINYKLRDIGKN